jgi:hypothetical protein
MKRTMRRKDLLKANAMNEVDSEHDPKGRRERERRQIFLE